MSGLVEIEEEFVVNICPENTQGDVIELAELQIQLPKTPPKKNILFHDRPKSEQRWIRQSEQ